MPATPCTETRWTFPWSAESWKQLLDQAELAIAAREGRLERGRSSGARGGRRPGRLARARRARPCPSARTNPPARRRSRRRSMRIVDSPTKTEPGVATDWIREAVFTRSPATIPWSSRAERHRGLAGQDAGARAQVRRADVFTEVPHEGRELQGGPDGALGVVLVRDRRSPERHHRVADELLDDPAVALHDLAALLEVAGQELPDLLGVARSESVVKPTRSANSTETRRRSVVGAARGTAGVAGCGIAAGARERRSACAAISSVKAGWWRRRSRRSA